ncbi:hypothetical protein RJ639_012884 [Escallonia herrerae]|uniref:Treslin n=1 Tax=Escallonia herrerae TaxID=1293975 RepID=A0AA89APQ8_9ASTE|nr:hypothetical protein RJ639_012884 [Escallonia herrerae]
MAAVPIDDYSNTQRILLLIDLTPILTLQNPTSYLTPILTAAARLLSFPPLSTSLSAFKLLYSSSALRGLTTTPLSFNPHSHTLPSLQTTLNSLSLNPPFLPDSSTSRASHLTSSLLQLVYDYNWESTQIENIPGKRDGFRVIPSNLVVLFSPVCEAGESMGIDVYTRRLKDRFRDLFRVVNDPFFSRDIHFSWVAVNYCELESSCSDGIDETDESVEQLVFFGEAVRGLGWGFSSTNAIVLGSAVIPFGLIYPTIGAGTHGLNFLHYSKRNKSVSAQLILEIEDVSGRPLECKCCDLELFNVKLLTSFKSDDIMHSLQFGSLIGDKDETFWDQFGDGNVKMHFKAVERYAEGVKLKECSSSHILVRGFLGESGKSRKSCDDFFANRVLELLTRETGESIQRNSIPIWQILLSFLYREGYWGLVSISNSRGKSCTGILKPFTAHLALLSVIDDEHLVARDFGGSSLTKMDDLTCEDNLIGGIGSQTGTPSSGNYVPLGDGKRKKTKKHSLQDLSWSSFCKVAFECSDLNLMEVYFSRESGKSKKLKFLKCWMKQIKKCSYRLIVRDGSKSHHHVTEDTETRLIRSYQKSEQPMPPHFASEPPRMQDGAAIASCSDDFFSSLPNKIQKALESGLDLQILAERLVKSSIHWLHQKCETDSSMESRTPMKNLEDSCSRIAAELIKTLIREPKELKEKFKEPSFQASETTSTVDNIVKEYPLLPHLLILCLPLDTSEKEILLRMEILRSEVAENINEKTKQKLVKHICSFLEIIQYLVEGGFHGHLSLYKYVESTIKTRYHYSLNDVVDKIYAKMDLLPFGDENESQVLLPNSEDSNHSWREKQDICELAETNEFCEPFLLEDESSQPLEHIEESPQEIRKEEHARRLSDARERRERARRFVSFTSRVADLQRVWAPKQPKAMRVKSESLQKEPKRKERQRFSIVCETPMSGKKCPCSQGSSIEDDVHHDHGSNSSTCVSKALFQDD